MIRIEYHGDAEQTLRRIQADQRHRDTAETAQRALELYNAVTRQRQHGFTTILLRNAVTDKDLQLTWLP